jgi:cellobiose phosphorylase
MDGKILDRGFSDNHVWITYTVYNLVLETGDLSLLDIDVPFNDGSSASIYEHMKRAVDYLWNDRGMFGLCRIHEGDWNDGMRTIGKRGEGVSVWLSMAWSRANSQFRELAQLHGRDGDAALAEERAHEMAGDIDRHAWDGEYYLRAFTDAGDPVGSHGNDHGTIFLNAQSWAVLGGVGLHGREKQAIEAADRLLDSDLGARAMLPFTHYDPNIGVSTRATPGVNENGSVYLHAAAFKLVADCMLKRRETVEAAVRKMLPFDETYHAKDCEPYVFCNSYLAVEDRDYYGWTGQSWGTGTAGWFYYALVVHIFGLKPGLSGLRLDPCLPPSWRQCGIVRPFRGAVYRVDYRQDGDSGGVEDILVDGEKIETDLLPYEKGRHFSVTVRM